ncbi:hypothetical protein CSOJ01_09959 [Colletotrichum sojae]|uniref:Uncharacterized protein n=1 Tax=Colletotrichum sojae TaxID=2175907 RepID=A0A8H6MQ03_9PEZI|nr:hypothetical protein CSOJ01_09959 [Colletotrichum sojae]
MDRGYETFAKCWAAVAMRSPNAPGDPFLSSVSQFFSGEIKAPSLEPAKLSPFASGLGKPGEGWYALQNSLTPNEHRTVVRRSKSELSPGEPLLVPEGRERVFAPVVVMRRAFTPWSSGVGGRIWPWLPGL